MNTRVMIIVVFCFSASSALGLQSSVPFIHADDVCAQGITGLGVTVAVIDTGIYYDEPGLAGSIAPGGISIINGQEVQDDGEDIWGYGHGTYMSLIITDQIGVAHDARILPVRVFGQYGADPDDVFLGINYVKNRRLSFDPSIRVINLSLGGGAYLCSCDDSVPNEAQAISQALTAGIITFAATQNWAICGGISAPACVSSAVRVAANYDAQYGYVDLGICGDYAQPYWVVCFSNIAEECNWLLAAPGYSITVGGFSDHGTSQATAHCSGVAALMFDKSGPCGSLDAYAARNTIFNTAAQYWWAYPRCPLPPPPRHVNALAAVNAVSAGSCSTLAGDMDCDDTFSPSDFGRFVTCMNGPAGGEAIGGGCVCADFPESPPDGDVDMRDFIHFQRAYSGGGSAGTVTLDLVSPEAGQSVEPGATVHWSVTATVSPSDNAGLAAVSVDMAQDAGNRWLFDIPPATVVGTGMEGFSPPDGIANPETGVAGSGYGGTPFGTAGSKNLWQIGGSQNTFGEAAGTGTDFIVDPQVGQTGPQVVAEGSFPAPPLAGIYVFRIENGLANVLNDVAPPPSPPAPWPVSGANVILNSSSFSVTVSHDSIVVADFDADGDVDQVDFGMMQRCYTGVQTLTEAFPDGSCNPFDLNGDNHVRYEDVTILDNCWSGPNVPADIHCAD